MKLIKLNNREIKGVLKVKSLQVFGALVVCLVFCLSCSGIKPVSPKPEYNLPKVTSEQVVVPRGQPRKVAIPFDQAWGEAQLFCDGKLTGFDYRQGFLRTYVAVPYEKKEGVINCSLRFNNDPEKRDVHVLSIIARDHSYPFETLRVSKKHIDLSPKDLARWQSEVQELNRVYSEAILDRALFDGPFQVPLKSKVTSYYGKRRVFNNKKDAVHKGTDFRARTGTPIPAANKGKVVFADDLFFNGNTVIIDHGLGVMTMYCHLSKLQTTVGEIVPQGAIIGLAGNTGRSTAAHLHWGVRVQDEWVDGHILVKEGI